MKLFNKLFFRITAFCFLLSGCCDSGVDCCGGKSRDLGLVTDAVKSWINYQQGDEIIFVPLPHPFLTDSVKITIGSWSFNHGTYPSTGDECPADKGQVWQGKIFFPDDSIHFMTYQSSSELDIKFGGRTFTLQERFYSTSGQGNTSFPVDTLLVGEFTYPEGATLEISTSHLVTYQTLYFAKNQGLVAFKKNGWIYHKLN